MSLQEPSKVISSAPVSTGGVTTIGQPRVFIIANLGREPTLITCPFCNMQTITKVEFHTSSTTHMAAIAAGSFDLCCMCLPYCCDCAKSAHHHHCGNCGQFIGKCD